MKLETNKEEIIVTRFLAVIFAVASLVSSAHAALLTAPATLVTAEQDSNVVLVGKRIDCTPPVMDPVCETYKRQQAAPKLNGPKKPTKEPMRCEKLLSDQPSAIVLRKGTDNDGPKITSWRLTSLTWKRGGGGYTATVCYPKRYDTKWPDKTFCADRGHYWFKVSHTSREYGAFCVAGEDWCGE